MLAILKIFTRLRSLPLHSHTDPTTYGAITHVRLQYLRKYLWKKWFRLHTFDYDYLGPITAYGKSRITITQSCDRCISCTRSSCGGTTSGCNWGHSCNISSGCCGSRAVIVAVIFVTLVAAVVVVISSLYCSEGNSAQGLTHAQTYLRADTPNNSVSGRGQHYLLLPFMNITY